ncbi:hypothetical protein A6A04_12545 [Paramagnetospirillum marisnigri]|uniref:Threonine transporter RhtB n=1 Tax=Paramagnetospirillum marisnigri TaxID=1285242 RepID=A0A178MX48_9PROT|nr:hypothetical protein [Paramagnetospirillum marisnigri]OAN54068.1 hypothetical protein A6A04_12545 [Paramagnetospirillum marisnigri]
MTDPLAFTLAVLALLATPGPTNTLLAASGATAGPRRSLALIPAELSAYLLSISTLALVVAPLLAAHALLGAGLKLAAAAWLVCCAGRLWREGGGPDFGDEAVITPLRIFTTTLLNPKGLIFAIAIFPPASPLDLIPWLVGFSGLAVVVAAGWITLGATLARSAGSRATPTRICRLAAVVLVVFAVTMAGTAVAAFG